MTTRLILLLALVVGVAGLLALRPATARAAAIVVTTATDEFGSGTGCSLREAIQAVNTLVAFGGCPAGTGNDTITFGVNGPITLTLVGQNDDANATGDLDLARSVSIVGNGATSTIIDGNGTDAVFDTYAAPGGTVINLSNLTIQHGNPTGSSFPNGGGFYVKDGVTANLNGVSVLNNTAPGNGAGIFANGTVNLTNSTVSDNVADGLGGGIYYALIAPAASPTISGSILRNNQAEYGGGIYASTDSGITLTITGSTFTGNQALDRPGGPVGDFGDGGGIYAATDGAVSITASTFTGNAAARNGGALFLRDDTNQVAIGSLAMSYSRISGNSATGSGSGVFQASGTAIAENNWWGCNSGPTTPPCDLISGTVDANPWIVLRHSANPSSVLVGQAATLTADFLRNSDNVALNPTDLMALVGLPITFGNAVLGAVSNAQTTIQPNGTASATFTAGSTAGTGHADATVDSARVTANITITRPATTVTGIARAASSPTNAASVSWTVTFADPVSGLAIGNFALANSGLGGAPAVTGVAPVGGVPTATWTVTASTGTGDGTVGLNLVSDTNLDHSVSNLPFPGESYAIDKTPPTADVVDVTPDPRASQVSTITITFSESVTGFDVGDLHLTRDGTPVALVGATLSGSGASYTLDNLGPLTGADGGYVLTLTASGSGIADAAGNALAGDAGDAWLTDTAPPTATIDQAAGQADPTAAGPVHFTVVFSEPVADFAAGDVTLAGTAGATTAVVTGGGTTYDVAVGGMAGPGTVVATLAAGVAHDAAGNPSAAATSTDNTVTFTGQAALTVTTKGPGIVKPGSGTYPLGPLTLTAVPNAGALFTGWTVDGVLIGWNPALAFTFDRPRTVVATFATRPAFSDVPASSVAWDAITQLAARGVIKGYGDGRYGPDDTVLRAQMAALIVRALHWDNTVPNGPAPFSDVGGVDAELGHAIAILASKGIINGYGDGRFGPTDTVLHIQVISFITRSMVQAGYWQAVTQDNPALYPNVPLSSGHRLDLLTYAKYRGAIPDRPAGQAWADWDQPASRGWTARILWQALDSYFSTNRFP